MIASAFEAQPNWKSSNGTPPTAPCSITQVTRAMLAFLDEDARHVGGNAEAEIDRVAGPQFLRDAPGDDLADAEFGQLERAQRPENLS